MLINKNPNISRESIPASASIRGRAIEVDLARTLSISGRCTYHASGTSAMRLNVYFSPDGENFDTIPYAYFDVDITAGAVCQESKLIDPPENGYLIPQVVNQDGTYSINNVKVWIGVSKYWEDFHKAIEVDAKREG